MVLAVLEEDAILTAEMALAILEHPLLAARTVTVVLGDVRSSRDLQ